MKEMIHQIGVLILLSYIYDINFKETLEFVKEENYIDKIFGKFNFKDEETKKQIEMLRQILLRYVKLRVKNRG